MIATKRNVPTEGNANGIMIVSAGSAIVMIRNQPVVIVMTIALKRTSVVVKFAKNLFAKITLLNVNIVR